jgi:hypothetical protein
LIFVEYGMESGGKVNRKATEIKEGIQQRIGGRIWL